MIQCFQDRSITVEDAMRQSCSFPGSWETDHRGRPSGEDKAFHLASLVPTYSCEANLQQHAQLGASVNWLTNEDSILIVQLPRQESNLIMLTSMINCHKIFMTAKCSARTACCRVWLKMSQATSRTMRTTSSNVNSWKARTFLIAEPY